MGTASAGLSISVNQHSEMRDKDDRLIVALFTLENETALMSRYDALRIKYCQRHRPPQVINDKYRTGDPFPRGTRSLLWEIIKLKFRRWHNAAD